jgi:primary-amine oxidase
MTGWFFRNVFGEGDSGVGQMATPLESSTDCPHDATFFYAIFANDVGTSFEIVRAVCLFERRILWKHLDYFLFISKKRSWQG